MYLPRSIGDEVIPCRRRFRRNSFLPTSNSAASEDSSLDESLEELSSDEDPEDEDLEDEDPELPEDLEDSVS